MGLFKGLTLSFAAIALVVYGLAIYSDPDSFWDVFGGETAPATGNAVSLESFVLHDDPAAGEAAAVASVTLLPPSEESYDKEFLIYRTHLMKAVAARDLEEVLSLVAPDVLLTVDGQGDRAELGALLDAPDEGEIIWQKLEDILDLPSTYVSETNYCAPYVACADLPEGAQELEPFETVFAVKADVPVRAAPQADAPLISSLSYQSVQLAAALEDPEWAEVILPNGETGFVARDDVRLMFGAQAQFQRQDGVWVMKSFLPGS